MLTLVKKIVIYATNTLDLWYNRFIMNHKKVEFVSFPKINGRIFITGGGKLKLGDNVAFNSGKYSNPIGGDTRMTISVAKGALLEIDDFAGISNTAIICHEKMNIGKHVKIGGNVKIYDTDFHSLDPLLRSNSETDRGNTRPVKIGDFCFIGAHSIILKGVVIGDNSIIGAGSVVTKSIPENEIWAGNPAKFIKKLTS
ncbi:acyltransferase [Maribacter algicola]|uniref:Acyltransferase n=1 Tax=Meishania litoralis TaxID=3434685 RepID=A0ACC7LNV5_9FLAO